MKPLIILVLSLRCEPEDLPEVLKHIDPPTVPHFDRDIRFAVEEDAQKILDWLEG